MTAHARRRSVVKKARRKIAHKLWNVASRIWVEPDYDGADKRGYWHMDCTFIGVESEAERIFEAMHDLGHAVLGLHESDSRFVVGGMNVEYDESDATDA